MKITFLHHSGFCVEIGEHVLIFDYFYGMRDRGGKREAAIPGYDFTGELPELGRDRRVHVFVSHSHPDHFDPEIFRWFEKWPDIWYIMPREMRFNEAYFAKRGFDPAVAKRIVRMRPSDCLGGEGAAGLTIDALLSTDEGVAYLVQCEGKTIYHAGDLHWWHWDGEPQDFLREQERVYKAQVDRLAGRKIDVAFVVMDSRLRAGRFWGMDYFLEHVDAKHVFPMHLWQQFGLIAEYKALPDEGRRKGRIVEVERENQTFDW